MKILFITHNYESLDIAYRCIEEGNKVVMFATTNKYKDIGDGIVPKTTSFKDAVDWADLIVVDNVKFGNVCEELRKKGKKVFGNNIFTDKIELDRDFGKKIVQQLKMGNIIMNKKFSSFDDGINFIKKYPARYVVKPFGNMETWLTFVGEYEDGNDVIEMLNYGMPKEWKGKPEFELEQFIDGIEIGLTCYFNGQDFVMPFNYLFEYKKLLTGNLGALTGEVGSMIMYPNTDKLFKETLLKLKPILQKTNYRCQINVGCIVNEKGIYVLEFGTRLGYPEVYILDELQKTEWSKIFYDIANGTLKSFNYINAYAIGVVVYSAGFPYEEAYIKHSKNLPLLKVPKDKKHFHFGEMKFNKGFYFTSNNGNGYTCIITNYGKTCDIAKKLCYKEVEKIKFPNCGYRVDISDRWIEDEKNLKKLGYLN
jgi:phosphoribosylamine--glycine ligase